MLEQVMEVYKSIKRSVSATANGIIGSSIFSNTTSASGNSGTHSWIHPPDTLINGRVEYAVKMLGKKDVQEAKGTHIVREAIHTIRFHLQVKRGETGHSGAKLQKVLLQISIYGVNVMDLKTRVILYKHPLNRISFCADDKMDKRVFSYIAKADDGKHQCFVFLSDKMAENITLTIGEAFDLAYEKFIKKKGKDLENQKQMLLLKKRIAELEEKNKLLETKLERCCCPEGRKISNLLIPKAPVPSKPPDIISTSILNGATSPPPPPLPILPPPRRTSSQNNSNILAEIFERNDNFNHGTQPVNFGELYDDSFDPRADEKKETATSSTESDAGQRNTVAEFEALLRLAEVQNGLSTWKFERGDTGDAGRDWPTESDEQKEEEPQLSCPPSSTSNAKG